MGLLQSFYPNETDIMSSNRWDLMTKSLDFNFLDNDIENGLYLCNVYLPEEIIIHILSFQRLEDIWKLRLVCKKWYNLTKTQSFWSCIFQRMNRKIPRKLPWYVYLKMLDNTILDKNLLKNNCGQEKLSHWKIIKENGLKVEETPVGSDPIPSDIPDFNGAKSCFVVSYAPSSKMQMITLKGNLSKYIIKEFKPHLYVSEWYAGRFDCGGNYELKASIFRIVEPNTLGVEDVQVYRETILEEKKSVRYNANEATKWQKVEILIESYDDDIEGILFEHTAKDNQFWAGHYGPKMAGGVVKFLSDTIKLKTPSESEDIL